MALDREIERLMAETSERLSAQENLRNVCHIRWHGEPLPSVDSVKKIVALSRAILFPGFFGESDINHLNVKAHTLLNIQQLHALLVNQFTAGLCLGEECENVLDVDGIERLAGEKAMGFIGRLCDIRGLLDSDVQAIFRGDPAVTMPEEVLDCYPGIRAVSSYRIAHEMVRLGIPVIPRMISEIAHGETGIDIHPAATIGKGFMIDHGTGIVIGATTVIGDGVKIYQGVTLGARSFVKDENDDPVKGLPRHPIIGDNVVIYANATILGRVTVGDGAVIGGNVWLTENVAPGERVLQAKAATMIVKK